MAVLGNVSYSSTYEAFRGDASTITAVPWTPFVLGQVQAPPYDDGSGLPGAGQTAPAPVVPTVGQLWPTGVLNPVTSSGARTTTSFTTAPVQPGFGTSGTVTLAPGYRVLTVATDRAARVRLYSTVDKMLLDVGRASGVYPTGDHGLLLEVVTSATLLSLDLSPTVDGFDGKAGPDGVIAYHVTNRGLQGSVAVTLVWSRTE